MYFHTLTRCLAETGFWNDCLQEDDARQLCKLKHKGKYLVTKVLGYFRGKFTCFSTQVRNR